MILKDVTDRCGVGLGPPVCSYASLNTGWCCGIHLPVLKDYKHAIQEHVRTLFWNYE